MPEQNRPATNKQAPNPAHTYERTDPKRESGQGSLDNNTDATPTARADVLPQTVANAQPGDKQLNSEEAATVAAKTGEAAAQPTEPLGWEKGKS